MKIYTNPNVKTAFVLLIAEEHYEVWCSGRFVGVCYSLESAVRKADDEADEVL